MIIAVCPLAPLRASSALGQMPTHFHALLPSWSDSQAGPRPVSGRHLLCSQMFPILLPSALQGGLLRLILVQMGMNFSGWKHSKAEGVIFHVLSSSMF